METASHPTLVVIGNGMVSYKFCEKFVENGGASQFRIVVFGEEDVPAYDRVHLTEFFDAPESERILLADETWYAENSIELRIGTCVASIDRKRRIVQTDSAGSIAYDKLVFATGSHPFVPPIAGVDLPGVFVYRTIADLKAIEAYSRDVTSAAVIGGGLLGLEAARALYNSKEDGIETHIVELAPHLMARQLNTQAAALLQEKVEGSGIQVHLNKKTTRITLEDGKHVLHFADKPPLVTDMVVISAGIRPRDELARACNLACHAKGGIEVNDELQTSDTDIYAIGECASHNGTVYGLVSPGYKMAETLAKNLSLFPRSSFKSPQLFQGADTSTTLKLLGVDVSVTGDYLSDDRHITYADGEVYRQLVHRHSKLIGATVVGPWQGLNRVQQAVRRNKRIWFWNFWRFQRTGDLWRKQAAEGIQALPQDAIVCNCMGVNRGELTRACAMGSTTVEALSKTTGASTVCGSCRPLLEEIVAVFAASDAGKIANPRLQNVWKWLFGASIVGLFLVLLISFMKPISFSSTVQNLHHAIDVLWRDNFWKQVTGYTLLGLSGIVLLLPLRKRWKRLSFGNFGIWRLIHVFIGVAALIFLIAHTGFRIGSNLNQILMISFLLLNLVGTLAGGITALATKYGSSATTQRWQRWIIQAHTVLFWPLPVLILFHIIAVYYF